MKKINFKTSITGIALFLFLIIGLATSCKKSTCNYAPCTIADSINVSTGLGKNGTIDPNWKVTSSPYINGQPIITPSHVSWQTTPIAGTNAGWINCTGVSNAGNAVGNYTYETTFNIAPNTLSFSCDFGIAYDDILVAGSFELIPPVLPNVSLSDPPHPLSVVTKLSSNVGTVISNPQVGVWKIRATVKSIDFGTGFLLSGFIKTLKPC